MLEKYSKSNNLLANDILLKLSTEENKKETEEKHEKSEMSSRKFNVFLDAQTSRLKSSIDR